MKSIKDVYKIGKGPSSSHTMGPARAMEIFVSENSDADAYRVVLFGSLADTGKGHGTDHAIEMAAGDKPCEIIFNTTDRDLPHENTMDIYAVRGGKDEYLIPAVPAFVQAIDIKANTIDIHVWEGLGSHEN